MGIAVSLVIFLVCVIIHEFAHALMAFRLGDPTAKHLGRLTLNPIAHIDPFGTVILPVLLVATNAPVVFGWAKPVPINFARLGSPKRDMIWVGFAGPAANLIMAVAATLLLKTFPVAPGSLAAVLLVQGVIINVVLAVFNLVPIPPLDGSRVLMGLAPLALARGIARVEPYGFLILFALLYGGMFDRAVWPVARALLYALLR